MGGEGVGEKSELVRLASGLERKMAYKEAEDFLKMLLRDRWLHEVVSCWSRVQAPFGHAN